MNWRRPWMLAGFVAAFIGDWLLAIQGASVGSVEFLLGVVAFSLAQAFWSTAHLCEAKFSLRTFLVVALPLGFFVGVRLVPLLDLPTAVFVSVYSVISAASLAIAVATRRRLYSMGILTLLASDVAIGCRWLQVPFASELVGPLYILAEVLLIVSFFRKNEGRMNFQRGNIFTIAVCTGVASALLFVLAMAVFPGGDYNPCLRMLSALGRTEVRLVEYPLSHFLFTAGMMVAALGIARMSRLSVLDVAFPRCFSWGTALNAAGLLVIAAIPENVNVLAHNVGCWLAAIGGGAMFYAWWLPIRSGRQVSFWLWQALLITPCVLMLAILALHGCKLIAFAPWFPSAQKWLILAFATWQVYTAWGHGGKRAKAVVLVALALPVVLAGSVLADRDSVVPAEKKPNLASATTEMLPLTSDELAALKWLSFVTGRLSPADEKEWWDIGGRQFGVFAKRYHIAFAGYAAAAIGIRAKGDDSKSVAARAEVGKILLDCIERYLRTENWAYSQARSYWGRKRWSPDPCYRENVMYTGHLLQLLALYEKFTGDTRFWKQGFDFKWKDKTVHYDVGKLIEVTVYQMRNGPNGGITCEPGLMFFPCNNHPHLALAIFSSLGHGNWRDDAKRWERWALGHYRHPFWGGGALNLVYHVRSGLMYPRGSNALDGWSVLWYEAWATDRAQALGLWRDAVANFDWQRLDAAADDGSRSDCCDVEPVAPSVTAAFLAAAARACDDTETGERLERAVDERHLVRRDGMYYLNLSRTWRIGATAHRIIALTESRGARFRTMLKPNSNKNKEKKK